MHRGGGKGVTEEKRQFRSSSVQRAAAVSRAAAGTEASGLEEAFEIENDFEPPNPSTKESFPKAVLPSQNPKLGRQAGSRAAMICV